jgi:hypothetical protein
MTEQLSVDDIRARFEDWLSSGLYDIAIFEHRVTRRRLAMKIATAVLDLCEVGYTTHAGGECLSDGSDAYVLVARAKTVDEADIALGDARPFRFIGRVQ